MKLLSFFTLFILIIVLTKQSSSRRIELTDHGAKGFLGLCPPKECELDQKYYESKEYRLKLYKLFTSGIPQIIWDHLKEKESKWSKSNPFNVSDRCFDGFKSVWKGIEDGDEWAFKFLDTSGKLPPSFMEATHTAIGDFSECLEPSGVENSPIPSQYCMVQIFPERPSNELPGKMHVSRAKTCVNCPFFQGLCLPQSCSAEDIHNLMSSAFQSYGIRSAGEVHCDTAKTISYSYKFSSFNTHQWISLTLIVSVLIIIFMSTIYHLKNKFEGEDVEDNLTTKLSLARNLWNLFHVKESQLADPRRFLTDTYKLVAVFSICVSHALTCADVPTAYFLIDRLRHFQDFLRKPQTQGMYNDAGLSGVTAFGGFAAFVVMYPMAKNKQLPYFLAYVDRFLKFLPSMIFITALDFIWPLTGSGPFHSHLSENIVDRCTRGWWANILMVSNIIDPEDTCAGHTFFASMMLQVVIVALIAAKIFSMSDRKGVMFCISLILFSWAKMYYSVATNDMTPTLMTPIPNLAKTRPYFVYIHSPMSTYLSPFFMGFLAGYWILKGNKLQILSTIDWIKWIIITVIPFEISHLIVMLGNSYEALPPALLPLAITVNRNMIGIGTVLLILILYSNNRFSKYLEAGNNRDHNNNNQKEDRMVFSLFTALLRISFSMFFINLYVARFEFFTRKSLIANEVLTNIQRVISSTVIVTCSAMAFHLLFVSPFDQVLKTITRGQREKHTKKSE